MNDTNESNFKISFNEFNAFIINICVCILRRFQKLRSEIYYNTELSKYIFWVKVKYKLLSDLSKLVSEDFES